LRIPKPTIEAIRDRTDIAEIVRRHVTLTRRGRSHVGLCPFHQEKTPSFHVLPQKQIFYCFGCGAGGDVFKFMMELEGLSFIEAVKELAGPAGVVIEERELTPQERTRLRSRATLYEVCEEACAWFHARLQTSSDAQTARDYLGRRGLSAETIERCRLGYAPDQWNALLDHLHRKGIDTEQAMAAGLVRRSERTQNPYDFLRDRIIFPILDNRDRPVAFGGRIMAGDAPKYLNTPETDIYDKSRTLYGLSWARSHIQRQDRVLVVEGYFDVLSLYQAGFVETVATCGTSLTDSHVQQISRFTKTVVALFDSDEAGLRAADRALPMFVQAGLEALQLELPGAKDPDEFVQEFGAEAFEDRLARASPLIEQIMRRAAQRHGSTPGGRQRAVAEIAPLLRRLPGVLQSDLLIRARDLLGVAEDALRREIGRPERAPSDHLPQPSQRWVGNDKLNHLLWLLLHYADIAAPQVSERGTEFVSDREDVRWAVYELVGGAPLASLLEELDDPDGVRVLQAAAARPDLYHEDQAPEATRQVLDRLEVESLETRIQDLKRHLLSLDAVRDQEEFLATSRELAPLQNRLVRLRPRAAAGGSPGGQKTPDPVKKTSSERKP